MLINKCYKTLTQINSADKLAVKRIFFGILLKKCQKIIHVKVL